MYAILKIIRNIAMFSCVLLLLWLEFSGRPAPASGETPVTLIWIFFGCTAVLSTILPLLPARLKAGARNLEALVPAAPEWLEFIKDPETAAEARIAVGVNTGRSVQIGGLARIRQEPGKEFFICDLAEARGPGRNNDAYDHFTAAFASADHEIFPDFRLKPRGKGVRFPANPAEVPGFPAFSDSYFLSGQDPAAAAAFFTAGPAAYFAARPGWTVHGRGRFLTAYKGENLVSPGDFPAFARECGELFTTAFRLGQDGFSGFHPDKDTLQLRGLGF